MMPEPLSLDEVRHVARLARLRLDDDELERCRGQLSTVLEHLATLAALDVEGVEPLAHPLDLTNRLGEDVVEPGLPREVVLGAAPATLDVYIAVPKVLDDAGGEIGRGQG